MARRRGTNGDDYIISHKAIGDWIDGRAGDDHLFGYFGADWIFGGKGDDQLSGGGNDDRLQGGVGNDGLDGEVGFDILKGGRGNDALGDADGGLLYGGKGNDILYAGGGIGYHSWLGYTTLDGGVGSDLLGAVAADGDVIRLVGGPASDTSSDLFVIHADLADTFDVWARYVRPGYDIELRFTLNGQALADGGFSMFDADHTGLSTPTTAG